MNSYNNMKIAVIDSGVKLDHRAFFSRKINGIAIEISASGELSASPYVKDLWGHGTAITGIISRALPDTHIDVFSVIDENSGGIDRDKLLNSIRFLVNTQEKYDIVNISLGSYYDDAQLKEEYFKLYNKGTIIVSAFDNAGAISFPAAYDFVIGVDSSNRCIHNDDFILVQNSIVNVLAKGGVQRLIWNDPEYIVNQGSSFAAAHVTVIIAKMLHKQQVKVDLEGLLKAEAMDCIRCSWPVNTKAAKTISSSDLHGKKCALFPFNKEMHNLLNMSDLLPFSIESVLKSRYVLQRSFIDTKGKQHMLLTSNECKWENIDVLILGHVDEMEQRTGTTELNDIINKCIQHHVMIYAFDDYSILQKSPPQPHLHAI